MKVVSSAAFHESDPGYNLMSNDESSKEMSSSNPNVLAVKLQLTIQASMYIYRDQTID